MTSLLRAHPGLFIITILLVASALILALVGFLMVRSGGSPKVIVWLAIQFGLIIIPQFVIHLDRAISQRAAATPRNAALDLLTQASSAAAPDAEANAQPGTGESAEQARRKAAAQLFGPDADPSLVLDARNLFQDALSKAESAAFASLPGGESALMARFRGSSEAVDAWVSYLRVTGLNGSQGKGDSERGLSVTRPTGDRLYAIPNANMLYVWTAADDSALRQRMANAGFEAPRRAPLEGQHVPATSLPGASRAPTSRLGLRTPTSLIGWIGLGLAFSVYVSAVVLWYFKGSTWAAKVPAVAGVQSVPLAELTRRLKNFNDEKLPYRLEPTSDPKLWNVTWKYADATWLDFARAHHMRRVHRLQLHLDETDHRVRVTESSARFDGSAGLEGARLEWKFVSGIVFFQVEHSRVFGAQLGNQGTSASGVSSSSTFDLQKFKAPFIDLVTQHGWEWRPVVWRVPAPLRWLTE